MFRQWLSRWFHGLAKRPRAKPARRTESLFVELLEDRTVPAAFIVNELIDTHAVNLISGIDSTGLISLRSAIEAVDHLGGDQTILFDPDVFAAPQTIELTLGVLDLKDATGDLAIQGSTAGVTISGNDASQVLVVFPGAQVNLTGLTISNGAVNGNGGGIYNEGTLTLFDSIVSGNLANFPAGGDCYNSGVGGGIFNKGTLVATESTIAGNTAEYGGGICNFVNAELTLQDCTVSGNTAHGNDNVDGYSLSGGDGGGIMNLTRRHADQFDYFRQLLGLGRRHLEWRVNLSDCRRGLYSFGKFRSCRGGIFDDLGTVTVRDSTISGNLVSYAYGGVYSYGGIPDGTAASYGGGGVYTLFQALTVIFNRYHLREDCRQGGRGRQNGGSPVGNLRAQQYHRRGQYEHCSPGAMLMDDFRSPPPTT